MIKTQKWNENVKWSIEDWVTFLDTLKTSFSKKEKDDSDEEDEDEDEEENDGDDQLSIASPSWLDDNQPIKVEDLHPILNKYKEEYTAATKTDYENILTS